MRKRENDSGRLQKIKADIALLDLDHPVTRIAQRTRYNPSNVSCVLRGTVTCTQEFVDRFYQAFGNELHRGKNVEDTGTIAIRALAEVASNLHKINRRLAEIDQILPGAIKSVIYLDSPEKVEIGQEIGCFHGTP